MNGWFVLALISSAVIGSVAGEFGWRVWLMTSMAWITLLVVVGYYAQQS